MIPQERRPAVERGLREAFDTTTIEDIRKLTKGLTSALVFRIVVKDSPYLLRIITRTDAMNDPTRQFACMTAGAEAGLAPRVWYANIEDRISITDFVEAQPLPLPDALTRMPAALRTLHKLPSFPRLNHPDALAGFIGRLPAAKLLDEDEIAEVFARYGQASRVYPRDESNMVSCHNDLKPENILFDGDHVWLVDWEAAFLNDRYSDLAIIANFLIHSEADEDTYLGEYFGKPPDTYQKARLFLKRQILHMQYAAIFLILGSSGKPLDLSESLPPFQGFHRRMWMGEADLADNANKVLYGRVHWARLLQNTHDERFDESLRIVAETHS